MLVPTPQAEAPPVFREVGAEVLPGVRTTSGSPEKDWIVETEGGGLALADLDLDGDHDLVVVDGSTLERVRAGAPGLPPRVFLNDGGRFVAGGESWELAPGRWGMGAACGDADGDGDPDLVVLEWGPNRFFENRDGEGFRARADAGLDGDAWSTSGAFLDFDRDGMLDLAVVNYLVFDERQIPSRAAGGCRWKGHPVMCGPEGLEPEHDRLYRNAGEGRFEDVGASMGFRPARAAYGLGIVTLDLEGDGDTDLYVANDSTPNHLWRNDGGRRFDEIGFASGVALDANGKEQAGMGIACGDVNDDLLPDLFVTNFSGEPNALYVSSASGRWRERGAPLGLAGPSMRTLGWGTAFGDVDLDGDLDLVVLNGHVYPEASLPGTDTSYAQEGQLFLNAGGRFAPEPLSDAPPTVSRAAAMADLDGDGRLDVVALDLGADVRVLRNAAPVAGRHWLGVRLAGRDSNRQGIGALLVATWDGGRALREIRTAGGFQAAVPAEAHFGLGGAERVRRLEIRWPSGRRQVLEDLAVDRVLLVEEPTDDPRPAAAPPRGG